VLKNVLRTTVFRQLTVTKRKMQNKNIKIRKNNTGTTQRCNTLQYLTSIRNYWNTIHCSPVHL